MMVGRDSGARSQRLGRPRHSSAQAYVTLSITWVYDTPVLNLVLTLPVETEEVNSG